MKVDARGAHWLFGSESPLTLRTAMYMLAEIPSETAEKVRTVIRKKRGTNGFFRSNLCSRSQLSLLY